MHTQTLLVCVSNVSNQKVAVYSFSYQFIGVQNVWSSIITRSKRNAFVVLFLVLIYHSIMCKMYLQGAL